MVINCINLSYYVSLWYIKNSETSQQDTLYTIISFSLNKDDPKFGYYFFLHFDKWVGPMSWHETKGAVLISPPKSILDYIEKNYMNFEQEHTDIFNIKDILGKSIRKLKLNKLNES